MHAGRFSIDPISPSSKRAEFRGFDANRQACGSRRQRCASLAIETVPWLLGNGPSLVALFDRDWLGAWCDEGGDE
jgi:hypothetical protein